MRSRQNCVFIFSTKRSINIIRNLKKLKKSSKKKKENNKIEKNFDCFAADKRKGPKKTNSPKSEDAIFAARVWWPPLTFQSSLSLSLPFSSLPCTSATETRVGLDSRRGLESFSPKMKLIRWSRELDEEKSDRHQKAAGRRPWIKQWGCIKRSEQHNRRETERRNWKLSLTLIKKRKERKEKKQKEERETLRGAAAIKSFKMKRLSFNFDFGQFGRRRRRVNASPWSITIETSRTVTSRNRPTAAAAPSPVILEV